MSEGELILYTTEDGDVQLQLRAFEGTVWLSQAEMALLFQTTPQAITQHLRTIYQEEELLEKLTCKDFLQVRMEGSREVRRTIKIYDLKAIIAVGYRVRSARGTQFRKWATTTLGEYLVKGFAMDDEHLKQADEWDYFDELLERIRAIRASEKRFYQKVRDLYATAVDYDKSSEQTREFFKVVQNKMLWAVTGKTAAEIIAERSNPKLKNMGLTTWSGKVVGKGDIGIAKNYLEPDAIRELDQIVVMYLDYAELQASRRRAVTMEEWATKLDAFLSFNDRPVLTHAGRLRMNVAQALAVKRYEQFDASRRIADARAEDEADLEEVEKFVSRAIEEKRYGTNE